MTTTETPSQSPNAAAVAATLRIVRAGIESGLAYLRKQDPEAADELDSTRRRAAERPVFVVVGETKRGKSSLVNSLLGVPGLSPVDAAVATSAYLELLHGEASGAHAYIPGREDPVPIELAGLRDWGTVLGQLPDGVRPPRRIEVRHPAALLERLTLVDTPGTGGLDSDHGEVALDAVGRATALLFVVDAAAPFAQPELDFLVEAAKRVNFVAFALTKTDAYPGWRTILTDNQALLQQHAPRFASAPWFPVSARLVELAINLPDAATALMAESRIPDLRRALVSLAGRGQLLAEANALRAVRAEFVRLDGQFAERIGASDPDPGEMDKAKAERSAIADRRRAESRQWPLALNAETNRARVDSTEQLRTRIVALQEHLLNRIDKASRDELNAMPAQVDQALAALSVQLSQYLQLRFQSIGERALAEVFQAGELQHVLTKLNATLRASLSAKPRRDSGGPDNAMVIMSSAGIANMAGHGAVAGVSAGAAAIGLGAAGVIVPVLGVGLGLAAGAFMVWKRRVATDRQQARTWLREVLAEARASLNDEISHRFTDLQYALTLALDDALARRIKDLDAHIAEIDKALAEDKQTRTKRKQALLKQREELRERIKATDEALVRARQAALPSAGQKE